MSVFRLVMATWSLPPSVWIVSRSWSLLARPVLAIVNAMWPTQLTVVVGTLPPTVVSTAKTPSPCANVAGAGTSAAVISTVSSPASRVIVMLSELSSWVTMTSPTAAARPAATSAAVASTWLRNGAEVMVNTWRPTVSTAPLTARWSPPLSRSRSSSIPVRFSGARAAAGPVVVELEAATDCTEGDGLAGASSPTTSMRSYPAPVTRVSPASCEP